MSNSFCSDITCDGFVYRSGGAKDSLDWTLNMRWAQQSLTDLLFYFAGYYVGPVVAYECQHYKLLTEANRNQNYGRFLGSCDEKLAEGWYRFASGAGMQMATKCLPMNRCDSRLPGWFWGRLPHKKEGCITGNVCFGTHRGGCCQRKRKILVRNCGKFYVYKLGPSPLCPSRYCGE